MQIILTRKRKIRLATLKQHYTYDGALLSAPNASHTQAHSPIQNFKKGLLLKVLL